MSIRCVTFDLDDTLWDTGPVLVEAERRFYSWLGEHCPAVTAANTPDDLVRDRREFMGRHPDQLHDLSTLRRRWLGQLFERHAVCGVDADAAFLVFWRHRNDVTLFDGALDMLAHTAQRYSTGVITNGNACVHTIGIGHLFDFVVSSERAGVAKPERAIFEMALADAGIGADEVAHVGDDPEKDVRGAAALGMRTVWYNPRRAQWPGGTRPDVDLAHLGELGSALEALV